MAVAGLKPLAYPSQDFGGCLLRYCRSRFLLLFSERVSCVLAWWFFNWWQNFVHEVDEVFMFIVAGRPRTCRPQVRCGGTSVLKLRRLERIPEFGPLWWWSWC